VSSKRYSTGVQANGDSWHSTGCGKAWREKRVHKKMKAATKNLALQGFAIEETSEDSSAVGLHFADY
jgi:hypothetical protein